MSYSISTLLTRNLHDVFGENDPKRRPAAIDEIFTEDCVFYDPSKGIYRGRDKIDRVAGAVKATHPGFRYQPFAGPEELGKGGRVQWVSGRPGEAPVYAGTDFIIARDGRIAAPYLFFDKLPRKYPDAIFCCRRQHRNDRDGGLGQLELGSVGSELNIAGPADDPGHFRRQRSSGYDRYLSQEGSDSGRSVFWRAVRAA
jgi:hypothetical protein